MKNISQAFRNRSSQPVYDSREPLLIWREQLAIWYRMPAPNRGRLCVAKSRVARARSVAAHENHKPAGAPVTKGLRDVLHRSKDATFGFHDAVAINTKLRSMGQMTEISIDTKNKRVRRPPRTAGGKGTDRCRGFALQFERKRRDDLLTIEEATASREWLTVALREFVVGQDLALPAKAGAVLKFLT